MRRQNWTISSPLVPSHRDWFVAIAVGAACAAFGRLLDVDWAGVGPIFAAVGLGQMIRRRLTINVYLSTTLVAFLASLLAGVGARWTGSQAVARAMVAPVLLLVPGVPAFNAQLDILQGRPTLGSGRVVSVILVLVFMAVGVWLSQYLLAGR